MINMSSRYQYRRAKRLQSKSKKNFIVTLIIVLSLLYVSIAWILPNFIGGLSFIKNLSGSDKKIINNTDQTTLAPPVLNIPFEATNSSRINISGYSSANSKVELFIDDQKIETTDVDQDGNFLIENVELSLGINNIYSKSVDEKGKESLASKTLRIIYDSEAPDLEIFEPEDNKNIQGGDKRVKIAGKTEVGAQIFINGGQVVVSGEGNFSSIQSLNDGENNFDIKSVDTAGNNTEVSRKVTYQP